MLWFVLTHPGVDAVAALVVVTWLGLSWPGVAGLAAVALIGLTGLRVLQPVWFARFVAVPVRDWLRWWFYRRRWKAAMTLAGLAPDYRGQPMLPVLDRVHRAGAVDLVRVGLVTGQAPADFEARAENLAHAFGTRLCRVRGAAPGVVTLELVRADTLADPIPALPITGEVDLAGMPVGQPEDGSPWRLRLASTHVLIAGATGSGKGPVIWSLIRELLEAAVAEMHDRAGQFGGRTRTFTPSTEFPFLVVLVDELAFLTAYQPERDLRKRAEALEEWLTRIEHFIKPSMVQNWRNYAAYYVIPYIGQRDVQEINGAVCDALYAKLLAEGRVKAKPKKRSSTEAVHTRRLAPDGREMPCRPYSYDTVRCYRKHAANDPLIDEPIKSKKLGRRAAEDTSEAAQRKLPPGLEPKTVVNTHRMLHRAWEDFAVWSPIPVCPAASRAQIGFLNCGYAPSNVGEGTQGELSTVRFSSVASCLFG